MTVIEGHAGGIAAGGAAGGPLRMIWAELGQECQISCVHCYAGAGPGLGWGTMTAGDWERVIGEAAGLGAEQVTFIGGEPTLYPGLPRLVRVALGLGLAVEVYSNLVRVTPALWELFGLAGVSLAVSWYSADREQHAVITGGHDTWRQTRANVARAVELGIPLRAGVVGGIVADQRVDEAEAELQALGVALIGRDELRQFGRGTVADASQACGSCGRGVLAVLPDGSVSPCPLTRWLRAGSVRDAPLGVIAGEPLAAVTAALRGPECSCNPDCNPNRTCNPSCNPNCQPACPPAGLCSPRCNPNSQCRPDCGPNCQPQCVPNTTCQPLCNPGACRPRTR
jgi:MoaA/NifB/PqqE/SkfB family radical SAM enzyme